MPHAVSDDVHKGWYHSRRLPHFDASYVQQVITFRLADSLPQHVLRQIEVDLKSAPESTREHQRRQRTDAWLDLGLGCRALENAEVAEVLLEGLLRNDGKRYQLLAWCVMPNHVHVMIQPQYSLARIVQSWKSYTGRWALAHNARLGLEIPAGSLWMRGYWDRFIRDEEHFFAAVDYIHNNPVKAGLCESAGQWRWSSAYEG
ncbi:MAG TPA: transposase [Pseudomonas xinjiangensis]|uniref:Transposase n=2 Tax=root TaxID=1 RepID=A0A7V1FSI5_9GAMM|nr:transposase [Halopseudomonas xinjiangensis]HEC49513.1 transposase [Halopseudomonas xinjiangensis]